MSYGSLFVQAAYLQGLSLPDCADEGSGWAALPGPSTAAPLYRKHHSYGEFVFDFQFAQAYAQVGLDYYPKLRCAVPFTPVPGPRLGTASLQDLQLVCAEQALASAHVLFMPDDELEANRHTPGWHPRHDLRFVWHRRGYRDFEDFLAALSSKRRKNIRAERRKVAALGLSIEWQEAGAIPASDWPRLYQLYASTYQMRGQRPYLTAACLQAWARAMPQSFQFCLARHHGEIVAMAFFFVADGWLYGRHWGSAVDADALHFELCYYQGIERALALGIDHFDAGVQGGHRLLRGFEPELSHSLHYFADARFDQAIGAFLERESRLIHSEWERLCQNTAFRQIQ